MQKIKILTVATLFVLTVIFAYHTPKVKAVAPSPAFPTCTESIPNTWLDNAKSGLVGESYLTPTDSQWQLASGARHLLFKEGSANRWYYFVGNASSDVRIEWSGSSYTAKLGAVAGGTKFYLRHNTSPNGFNAPAASGTTATFTNVSQVCGATNVYYGSSGTTLVDNVVFPTYLNATSGSYEVNEAPDPCEWNSEIEADDPACTPCEYNAEIWSGAPECVPPPEPCEWNPEIEADDPLCVEPSLSEEPLTQAQAVQLFSISIMTLITVLIAYQFRWRP